jgi:hypothetical protein
MIKLIGISFILCCSLSYCFGQKKNVDYIKTTKLSHVNYVDKNTPLFKSEELFTQYYTNGRFYKKVRYNADSSIYSYSLEYSNDGANFESYEMVSIYYSFDHTGNPFYGIFHSVLDTSRSTVNRISIEKDEGSMEFSSNMEMEYLSTDLTENYKVPNSIATRYINWVKHDLDELDSMNIPPWLGAIDWNLKQSRQSFRDLERIGHNQTATFYYVDKYYSDSIINVDTVLIKQVHSDLVTENSKTRSLNEVRTDSTLHHEEYLYFSDLDSTFQIMYDLLNGDTVSRIFLSTVLLKDTLYSHYKIIGNHPRWGSSIYTDKYLGEVLEREIFVKRDSSGYIVSGWAKGVVVDELKGNQNVRCLIGVRENGKRPFMQKKVFQGHDFSKPPYPSKVYVETQKGMIQAKYDLISSYPNFDLKPLMKIKRIRYLGIIDGPENKPQISGKRKFRIGRRQRRKYKPEYKRGTKKTMSNRKKKYERWEKEDAFQEKTIYEVYYK